MDAIEKAIRNAFEKGDADDRAFREKVYRSAFAALDRALMANPGITVEVAIKRRKAMQAKIAEIESEFLPAIPAVAPDIELPAPLAAEPETAPSVPTSTSTPASDVQSVLPDIKPDRLAAGMMPDAEVAPDRDERRLRRQRLPLASILVGVLVVAAIGIGLLWSMQSGALRASGEHARPSASTPDAGSGNVSPDRHAAIPRKTESEDQDRAWIDVFSPSDPALVSAPSDAEARVMQDDTGSFLRIRSGDSGSAVSFDVGQGVLEQLVGRHAVFDIVARAEDGKDTQISVDCNFGEMGDCGRKRYAIGQQRDEYLFDVQFPEKQPGSAGTIAINSDFDGQGKAVDIYAIRVSPAD